jgi:hypothetical protein
LTVDVPASGPAISFERPPGRSHHVRRAGLGSPLPTMPSSGAEQPDHRSPRCRFEADGAVRVAVRRLLLTGDRSSARATARHEDASVESHGGCRKNHERWSKLQRRLRERRQGGDSFALLRRGGHVGARPGRRSHNEMASGWICATASMEGDSGGVTAAFRGCRSAPGADCAPRDASSSSRAGAQELAASALARA